MTNKDIEKSIIDILSDDAIVKDYKEKKKNKTLTFSDRYNYVKYLVMKISELYTVFHN